MEENKVVEQQQQQEVTPEVEAPQPPEQPSYFDRESRRAGDVIPFPVEEEEHQEIVEEEKQTGPFQPQAQPQVQPQPQPQLQQRPITVDDMVRQDPELGRVIQNYIRQKMGLPVGEQEQQAVDMRKRFEIKPLSEYADESEWLKDHMQRYREQVIAEMEARNRLQLASTMQQQRIETIRAALFARDPEHAHTVIPRLVEYSNTLPKERLDRINAFDIHEIFKFYDEVKARVIGSGNNKERQAAPWRMRSSRAMASTPPSNSPWNMSKEEFEARIAAAKGLA